MPRNDTRGGAAPGIQSSGESDAGSTADEPHPRHADDDDDNVSESDSEARFTRDSFASSAPSDQFRAIVASVRDDKLKSGEKTKADAVVEDISRAFCTIKSAYLAVGVFSCVLEISLQAYFAFGSPGKDSWRCGVFNPTGRCCTCPIVNQSRLIGQEVLEIKNYNVYYYSVLYSLNAVITLAFIVSAVSSENKYALVGSLVAKIVGGLREATDIALHSRHDSTIHLHVIFLSVDALCVVVMCALMPRLLRTWGWKIFHRSGGNPEQREVYKLYQIVRMTNWLESQSSICLHALFVMWFGYTREQFWTWAVMTTLEIISSRQAIHCLKRENRIGCYAALLGKLFCNVYCITVSTFYFMCRVRFDNSLHHTQKYWRMDPYPDMLSIRNSYNGLQCLPPDTAYDDTIIEIMIISLSIMTVFRFAFIICYVRIMTKFDNGLKELFYKVRTVSGHSSTGTRSISVRMGGGGGGGSGSGGARNASSRSVRNNNSSGAVNASAKSTSSSSGSRVKSPTPAEAPWVKRTSSEAASNYSMATRPESITSNESAGSLDPEAEAAAAAAAAIATEEEGLTDEQKRELRMNRAFPHFATNSAKNKKNVAFTAVVSPPASPNNNNINDRNSTSNKAGNRNVSTSSKKGGGAAASALAVAAAPARAPSQIESVVDFSKDGGDW